MKQGDGSGVALRVSRSAKNRVASMVPVFSFVTGNALAVNRGE